MVADSTTASVAGFYAGFFNIAGPFQAALVVMKAPEPLFERCLTRTATRYDINPAAGVINIVRYSALSTFAIVAVSAHVLSDLNVVLL